MSAEALHRSGGVLRPKEGLLFWDITGMVEVLSPKTQRTLSLSLSLCAPHASAAQA